MAIKYLVKNKTWSVNTTVKLTTRGTMFRQIVMSCMNLHVLTAWATAGLKPVT